MTAKTKKINPICTFCSKEITKTPCLKLISNEIDPEEILMHHRCANIYALKKMESYGLMKCGNHGVILEHANIKRTYRQVTSRSSLEYGHRWAPVWAVSFAKATRMFDNDSRHTALHMCARLKDLEKQQQFCSIVRLGGEKALHQLLAMEEGENVCCARGKRLIKRLKKNEQKLLDKNPI